MRVTTFLKKHPDRLEDVYRRIKKFTNTSGECHEWTGEMRAGYPVIAVRLNGKRRRFLVHRTVWEKKHGPTKLTIDHVCRNKLCVRMHRDHLEAVTNGENVRRENAALHGSNPPHVCKRGHKGEYRKAKNGKLYCMGCHREQARERYHRLNGAMQKRAA